MLRRIRNIRNNHHVVQTRQMELSIYTDTKTFYSKIINKLTPIFHDLMVQTNKFYSFSDAEAKCNPQEKFGTLS